MQRDFHAFLATVPAPGDQLVIIGDLFDFWFEYGRVIPRAQFTTLSALFTARERGVEIAIVGGNHDRWGGDFFSSELGIAFFDAGEAELQLAGKRVYIHHGDGVGEQRWTSDLLHWITRRRATIALFRALHPDLGFWLADRLASVLADTTRDESIAQRAAAAQEAWARAVLERRPELDLVVAGHTHRGALVALGKRWYVNPGAFLDEGRYVVLTEDGPVPQRFRENGEVESRSSPPPESPRA